MYVCIVEESCLGNVFITVIQRDQTIEKRSAYFDTWTDRYGDNLFIQDYTFCDNFRKKYMMLL